MIKLNQTSIENVRTLLLHVPDEFAFVALKFVKTETEVYAAIENVDINGTLLFSSKINLEFKDVELDIDIMHIRIPINKLILSTIFSNRFEYLIITEEKIVAQNESSTLSIALLEVDTDSLIDLPHNSLELYQMTAETNGQNSNEYIFTTFTLNDLQSFISCFDVLSEIETVKFDYSNKKLKMSASDYAGNSFVHKLNLNESIPINKLKVEYNSVLYSLLSKLNKLKYDNIEVLISTLCIAFTVKSDNLIATYALGADGAVDDN